MEAWVPCVIVLLLVCKLLVNLFVPAFIASLHKCVNMHRAFFRMVPHVTTNVCIRTGCTDVEPSPSSPVSNLRSSHHSASSIAASSPVDKLSPCLVEHVLSFFSAHDLAKVQTVCKTFNLYGRHPSLWQAHALSASEVAAREQVEESVELVPVRTVVSDQQWMLPRHAPSQRKHAKALVVRQQTQIASSNRAVQVHHRTMRSAVRAQRVVDALLPRHPDALALSFVFMLLPIVCYMAQRCASMLDEAAFTSYLAFVLHELRLYTHVAPVAAVGLWVLHTCLPQRQIIPQYLQPDLNKIVGFQFVQWVVVEYLYSVFGWTTPYYFQVLQQVVAPEGILGKIHALATLCGWAFYYVNIFPYHFVVTLVWSHWTTVFPIAVTLLRWTLPVAACIVWGFRRRHRHATWSSVLMSVAWAGCELLGYLQVVNLAEVTARIVDASVSHAALGWTLLGWLLLAGRVVGLVGTASHFTLKLQRLAPGALVDTAHPIDRKQLDVMNGAWSAMLPLVAMVAWELGACYVNLCPSLTSVLVRPLCAVVTLVAPAMVATELALQGAAALWQAVCTGKHKQQQVELGSSLEFWVCSAGLVTLTVLSACLGWAPTAVHYGMSSVWFALWLDL